MNTRVNIPDYSGTSRLVPPRVTASPSVSTVAVWKVSRSVPASPRTAATAAARSAPARSTAARNPPPPAPASEAPTVKGCTECVR